MKIVLLFVSFLCIFLFVEFFKVLNQDWNKITYVLRNRSQPLHYIACVSLENVNQTLSINESYDLTKLNDQLLKYFQNLSKQDLDDEKKILIIQLIKSKSYIMSANLFCALTKNKDHLALYENFTFKVKPNYYEFDYETHQFEHLKDYDDKIYQLVVYYKEAYSNCKPFFDDHEKKGLEYSKFSCLNDCFMDKYSAGKYFYRANLTAIIHTNYNESLLRINEKNCLKSCPRNGCKFVYLTKDANELNADLTVFEETSFISNYEYFSQLMGLISLIFSISLYQILSKLINFIQSKVKTFKIKLPKNIVLKVRKQKIKKFLFFLKVALFVICFLCFLFTSIQIVIEYNEKINYPSIKQISFYQLDSKDLSIVICKRIEKLNMNKTLNQLENETNLKLNQILNEPYIEFLDKRSSVDYELSNKVLFKGDDHNFSRCFQFHFYPKETKFKSIFTSSYLKFSIEQQSVDLYILAANQHLDSAKKKFYSNSQLIRKIKERFKISVNEQCFNYTTIGCLNRFDCIDKCINWLFQKNLKGISIYSTIDKDHLTNWNNLHLIDNKTYHNEIKIECSKFYNQKECYKDWFESVNQLNIIKTNKSTDIAINLHYDILSSKQEDPSIFKLILDLLNIQSILIGTNTFQLLSMIYLLIMKKLKLNQNKLNLFLIYLICLAGFIYQIYLIWHNIIHSDLVYSIYYGEIDPMIASNLIFCLDLNQIWLDRNHELTKNYLNEKTQKIDQNLIFNRILYLTDEMENWLKFDLNQNNSMFEIKKFFFSDKKCFEIQLNYEYRMENFYYSTSLKVIEIFFNKFNLINETHIWFFTKDKHTMQYSRILNLDFKIDKQNQIILRQRSIDFTYYDKFSLTSLSFMFSNNEQDDNNDLNKTMIKFEDNFQLSTLNLPLYDQVQNYRIDDELFEIWQTYNQNSIIKSKNKKKFIFNHFLLINRTDHSNADFIFELNYLKKVAILTNSDNHITLVLNFLNALSTWLSIGILELHVYLYKIKFIFIFLFKLIVKFEKFARKLIL